jgi:hypothetical protein
MSRVDRKRLLDAAKAALGDAEGLLPLSELEALGGMNAEELLLLLDHPYCRPHATQGDGVMAKKSKVAATPATPAEAEVLSSFEFKSFGEGKTDYPWAKWMDGQIRKLLSGVHFTCKEATFLTLARSAAKKRGKIVQTSKVEGGVVIQAVPASEEQLQKWAEQEAIRKAKEAEAAKEAEQQEAEGEQ